jgi:hypothetical protein
MNKKFSLLLGVAALSTVAMTNVHAQDDDRLSVDFSMNLDAFFGLNPFLGASYTMDNGMDLTFYGIQWGAGTGSAWGQWTEFGVGVAFPAFDGAVTINPQIGFTSGSLLSSGAAQPGVVGDGIVPNLTVNLDTDNVEGQVYFGWYKDLQNTAGPGESTNQYIHYWANLGYKLNTYFSAGVHLEELYLSGGSNIPSSVDGYLWFGPYFQVAKGNAGMRFSFGGDYSSKSSSFSVSDFYKLQFFFSY